MKYYLFVLGCQMNVSDSERIARVLENLGYKKTTSEKEADLIMVVACSVRQSAIDRIHGKTKIWHKLRTQNSHLAVGQTELKTILSGCVLEKDRAKLDKHFDIIFNIKDLAKLPKLLEKRENKIKAFKDYLDIHPKYISKFSAFVPISIGCNNFCAYCAVPYTRGREISRLSTEIISEVECLISKGYKEISLLGQNVNSYGQDKKDEISFPELLTKINNISGDFWIHFITSHPKDMSDELIKTVAEYKKVTKYIHLPFQAGNNDILRKMNRKYTKEDYLKLVKKIKKAIPNVAISTDVIVGFPTETKEQFQETVNIMEEVKFDMAYIAQYSPRSQTAAAKLKDDISKEEKKRRKKVLNKILEKTALEKNKKYIGKEIEALVENSDKKGNLIAKTQTFKSLKFIGNKDLIGKFVKVKITDCNSWGLEGELIE